MNRTMYCVSVVALLSLVLGFALGAAPRKSNVPLTQSQLAGVVDSLIENKGSRAIRWGVCIARANTGETVFAHDSDALFIPASNRKLFVTALALDQLGPDFRFTTPLFMSEPLSTGGLLRGDVIIKGSGDPTFLNPRFHSGAYNSTLRDWTDALASLGLREVQGDLVLDNSHFATGSDVAAGWIKDYETAEYAPRTSAICIAGNRVSVSIRPTRSGQPPEISLVPPNSIVQIDNEARTGPRRCADTIEIVRADHGPDHLIVRGRLASNAGEQVQRVPLEQPELVTGEVFRAALEKKGIQVRGAVRLINGDAGTSATQCVRVAEYQSPPLRQILAVTNKHSDNYCAEQIFQAVVFAKTGRASYADAKAFEETFLARVGILPAMANFEDGSGLSRLNLVSPGATVRLLCYMAAHRYGAEFKESLPVAGRDGTLAGRMSRARGQVRAKTGCLSMASCLSGYAETKSGELIAFSIFANDCAGHISQACSIQDRICESLVNTRF